MSNVQAARKPPTPVNQETSQAIKAVNNVIVTVEKTGAMGKSRETFITQKGGKM